MQVTVSNALDISMHYARDLENWQMRLQSHQTITKHQSYRGKNWQINLIPSFSHLTVSYAAFSNIFLEISIF